MTSIGRYTLIVEEQEAKHSIPLATSNSDKAPNNIKVDLATIDCYTTKFYNPQQIIENLKDKQIVVKDYRAMYIGYRYNQVEQRLEVAFSEHEQLSKIARKSDSKVNINNLEFIEFLNRFLRLLDNNSFYDFLLEQKNNGMYIISDKLKLKNYLDERYSDGRNEDFTVFKIKEHMASYKKFRDIYFAVYAYNQIFNRLSYFLEDSMFREEVLASINIDPKIKTYIRNCSNGILKSMEQKIKEEITYSDLTELENLVTIFEQREKVEEERTIKEAEEMERLLLSEEDPKEKYPEAYVEHKLNPYSSYEEEQEYEQYLDDMVDVGSTNIDEQPETQKVKVLKKKVVDPGQLTLFDYIKK